MQRGPDVYTFVLLLENISRKILLLHTDLWASLLILEQERAASPESEQCLSCQVKGDRTPELLSLQVRAEHHCGGNVIWFFLLYEQFALLQFAYTNNQTIY